MATFTYNLGIWLLTEKAGSTRYARLSCGALEGQRDELTDSEVKKEEAGDARGLPSDVVSTKTDEQTAGVTSLCLIHLRPCCVGSGRVCYIG